MQIDMLPKMDNIPVIVVADNGEDADNNERRGACPSKTPVDSTRTELYQQKCMGPRCSPTDGHFENSKPDRVVKRHLSMPTNTQIKSRADVETTESFFVREKSSQKLARHLSADQSDFLLATISQNKDTSSRESNPVRRQRSARRSGLEVGAMFLGRLGSARLGSARPRTPKIVGFIL